jgi:hypothetical protein
MPCPYMVSVLYPSAGQTHLKIKSLIYQGLCQFTSINTQMLECLSGKSLTGNGELLNSVGMEVGFVPSPRQTALRQRLVSLCGGIAAKNGELLPHCSPFPVPFFGQN